MKINDPEQDKISLTIVGLLWASVMYTKLSDKPTILQDLDIYVPGIIRFGSKICHPLSGQTIRFEKVAGEYNHVIQLIDKDLPLMLLIVKEMHNRMRCNRGIARYIDEGSNSFH